MKSISHIISNLSKSKNLNRLENIRIINKLIATFPLNFRKSYLFSVIKNNTLYLALNHPSYVNEINNYKKDIILKHIEVMQDLYKDYNLFQSIKDIKAYLPKNILNNLNLINKNNKAFLTDIVVETYVERASGEFNINSDNVFFDKFNRIKSIIIESNRYN